MVLSSFSACPWRKPGRTTEYSEDQYEIVGMLWVQGEADSGVKKYGPIPASSYGENLSNLFADSLFGYYNGLQSQR